jgi:hypothetical protein
MIPCKVFEIYQQITDFVRRLEDTGESSATSRKSSL